MYTLAPMANIPPIWSLDALAKLRARIDQLIPDGSLGRRLARGALWSIAGSVVSQALGLATYVVAARILGSTGYGGLGVIRSTVGMFAFFGTGLSLTVTKHIAACRDVNPERASRILALSRLTALTVGCLFAFALAAFGGPVATDILHSPGLVTDLRLGAGLLLFGILATVQNGALAGLESFRAIARLNLLRGILGLLVVLPLSAIFGLRGAVLGLVVTAAFGWAIGERILLTESAKFHIRRTVPACWTEARELWRFSSILLVCDMIGPPAVWASNALLVRQSDGIAAMGVFSAAVDWMVVAMAIPSLITSVTLPVCATLRAAGRHSEFARFTRRSLGGISLLSLIISSALALCAPLILSLYGGGYLGHAGVVAVLLGAAGLANVSNAMRAVAISSDAQHGVLAAFAAYGLSMVSIMYWQGPQGAIGRAWAHLGADSALFLGLGFVTWRVLRAPASPRVAAEGEGLVG